ncbi:MAG: exosortase C-terminal domain/associated protein EpsI [Pseudomonadota bacterium]
MDWKATQNPYESGLNATGLLLVGAAIMLGYAISFSGAALVWADMRGHYSHGFLVVGIVIFRIWQDYQRLSGPRLENNARNAHLLALLACAGIWLASILAGVQSPAMLSALAVAWLGLGIFLGQGALVKLSPHFVLLYLIIPVWQPLLNPPLQDLATTVVNWILQMAGLTIHMDGNTIHMPMIIFEIIGGCSGLGFLFVAVTLAIYVGLTDQLRLEPGLALLGLFSVLALLSNWVRIALIMTVGYHDPAHSLMDDHAWFGWVVFFAIFVPVIWYLRDPFCNWSERLSRQSAAETEDPQNTADAAPKPVSNLSKQAWILPGMAILAIPAFYLINYVAIESFGDEPITWSVSGDSMFSPDNPLSNDQELERLDWAPVFADTDFRSLQSFAAPDQTPVYLFQAGYQHQQDGREVADSKNALGDDTWEIRPGSREDVKIELGNGKAQRVILDNTDNGESLHVTFWYQIGNMQLVSTSHAKVAMVLQKLLLDGSGSITAIAALCNAPARCESARESTQSCIRSLVQAAP